MKKLEKRKHKNTQVISIEGEIYASLKHFCNVYKLTSQTLNKFIEKVNEKYPLDVYFLGKAFYNTKEIEIIINEFKVDEERIVKNILEKLKNI